MNEDQVPDVNWSDTGARSGSGRDRSSAATPPDLGNMWTYNLRPSHTKAAQLVPYNSINHCTFWSISNNKSSQRLRNFLMLRIVGKYLQQICIFHNQLIYIECLPELILCSHSTTIYLNLWRAQAVGNRKAVLFCTTMSFYTPFLFWLSEGILYWTEQPRYHRAKKYHYFVLYHCVPFDYCSDLASSKMSRCESTGQIDSNTPNNTGFQMSFWCIYSFSWGDF